MLNPCMRCEGKTKVADERGFFVTCGRCAGNGQEPGNVPAVENAAKQGKVRPTLVDPEFVLGMARVMESGLVVSGRVPNGWKTHPSKTAVVEYADSLMRHALDAVARVPGIAVDEKSGEDALLHVATCAMILRWHLRNLANPKEVFRRECRPTGTPLNQDSEPDDILTASILAALAKGPVDHVLLESVDDDFEPAEARRALHELITQGRVRVVTHPVNGTRAELVR